MDKISLMIQVLKIRGGGILRLVGDENGYEIMNSFWCGVVMFSGNVS